MGTMLDKTVTLQYPEERPVIPDNYRGVPTLVKDPNGREKCVSSIVNCLSAEGGGFNREIDAELEPERAQSKRHLKPSILTCCAVSVRIVARSLPGGGHFFAGFFLFLHES